MDSRGPTTGHRALNSPADGAARDVEDMSNEVTRTYVPTGKYMPE